MKAMVKPERLKPGDLVALVSLSSGMAGEELFSHRVVIGTERLEKEFGLKVVVMPNAMRGTEYLDQNPQARAMDLMEAFEDSRVKAIFTMIGGDDTIRLLPYIDFEVIKNNPKIFMGYSDTTVNHFMMYKAGLVSFYGPCVLAEFAENVAMHEYTKRYLKQVLFEDNSILPFAPSPEWTSEYLDWADPENNRIPRKMIKDGKGYELLQGEGTVQGTLIGGCADVLPMVIGTELWPRAEQWEDSILFLETSEETPSPSSLRYLLRGLAAQGIFAKIKGIVFGKPMKEKYYEEYKEVLLQVVGKEAGRVHMPILYNMNFGHTAPICTLPYGIKSEIECETKSFRLIEPACR
ncbi:LD-carboxypeptidase [Ruminococcaceae bacterium OttesenSCG-928-I18]|nr:LD-carboxypeptidase [Ruminococcaceae bacterium OttesenSCG-928-I18]